MYGVTIVPERPFGHITGDGQRHDDKSTILYHQYHSIRDDSVLAEAGYHTTLCTALWMLGHSAMNHGQIRLKRSLA